MVWFVSAEDMMTGEVLMVKRSTRMTCVAPRLGTPLSQAMMRKKFVPSGSESSVAQVKMPLVGLSVAAVVGSNWLRMDLAYSRWPMFAG